VIRIIASKIRTENRSLRIGRLGFFGVLGVIIVSTNVVQMINE